MKRSEAEVGQRVWCGSPARPSSMQAGVIVSLDCGDNGYRVLVQEVGRDGARKWPLHSVHDAAQHESALAAAETRAKAQAEVEAARRVELELLRQAVAELERETGASMQVVPDMRSGDHYVRLSSSAVAAVLGAWQRRERSTRPGG